VAFAVIPVLANWYFQPPGKVALRAENRFAETLREAVEPTRQRRNWPIAACGVVRFVITVLR
jgi:hypothetical protein